MTDFSKETRKPGHGAHPDRVTRSRKSRSAAPCISRRARLAVPPAPSARPPRSRVHALAGRCNCGRVLLARPSRLFHAGQVGRIPGRQNRANPRTRPACERSPSGRMAGLFCACGTSKLRRTSGGTARVTAASRKRGLAGRRSALRPFDRVARMAFSVPTMAPNGEPVVRPYPPVLLALDLVVLLGVAELFRRCQSSWKLRRAGHHVEQVAPHPLRVNGLENSPIRIWYSQASPTDRVCVRSEAGEQVLLPTVARFAERLQAVEIVGPSASCGTRWST